MESNEHSHEDITNQCSRPYTAVLIQCDSVINSIQTYSQNDMQNFHEPLHLCQFVTPQTIWYTLSPMGLITKKVGGKCMTEVPSHDLSSPHCVRSRPKTEVLKQLRVSHWQRQLAFLDWFDLEVKTNKRKHKAFQVLQEKQTKHQRKN
jgi:hypothetical protein